MKVPLTDFKLFGRERPMVDEIMKRKMINKARIAFCRLVKYLNL